MIWKLFKMCSLKAHILDYEQSAAMYVFENVTMKPVIFVY